MSWQNAQRLSTSDGPMTQMTRKGISPFGESVCLWRVPRPVDFVAVENTRITGHQETTNVAE
jgi:hypothetical protein